MKRLYVDCSMIACSPEIRKDFVSRLLSLERTLVDAGFEVLNFETPHLPFDPFKSSIADFVGIADAVVVLVDHPSVGFSSAAREACARLHKPMFACFSGRSVVNGEVWRNMPETAAICSFSTPAAVGQLLRQLST